MSDREINKDSIELEALKNKYWQLLEDRSMDVLRIGCHGPDGETDIALVKVGFACLFGILTDKLHEKMDLEQQFNGG